MKKYTEGQMRIVNSRLWIFIVLLGSAVVASSLIAVRREPVQAGTWQQSDSALGYQRNYTDSTEEVSLILSSSGFAPAHIAPSSGRFLISVDNRTGLKELVLKLSDKNGKQLRELRVSGGPGDWNELIELDGGKYILSEAHHPKWTCQIVIP
jgi:hypothetical protein